MQTAKRRIAGWLLLMPLLLTLWIAAAAPLTIKMGWLLGLLVVAGAAIATVGLIASSLVGLALLLTDPEDREDS